MPDHFLGKELFSLCPIWTLPDAALDRSFTSYYLSPKSRDQCLPLGPLPGGNCCPSVSSSPDWTIHVFSDTLHKSNSSDFSLSLLPLFRYNLKFLYLSYVIEPKTACSTRSCTNGKHGIFSSVNYNVLNAPQDMLVFLSIRTHCWSILSCPSTKIPKTSWVHSGHLSPVTQPHLHCSRNRILHLLFLNIVWLVIAQYYSLSRSLFKSSLPSREATAPPHLVWSTLVVTVYSVKCTILLSCRVVLVQGRFPHMCSAHTLHRMLLHPARSCSD